MKLWIRSQDKMKLIPINDELYIPNSRTGEDFGIFYRETMLGYYKTKERTLEVLDEIHNYMNFDIKLKLGTCIYEMPEE